MASVNKVILVGNLGRDPELRSFPNGGQVANVTIATTDRWRDRNSGENREATEWHRVVFNDRLAEIVGQYLRKGSQVYVEGSLRTRKWTDPQTGQERYATEIRADTMQMLGSRQQEDSGRVERSNVDYYNDGWGAGQGQEGQPPSRRPSYNAGNRPPAQGMQPPQRSHPPAPAPVAAPPVSAPAPLPAANAGFDDFADDDIPF